MNIFEAWTRYLNTQILTLGKEYLSVPVDIKSTSARKVNYWLTRFIREVMKTDGTPHSANSLYLIACGLVRYFRDNMKRFDLNILSKEDANFDSFRKALDCRMKEITAAGVGTKKQQSDPLSIEDEAKLCSSGTVGLHSYKSERTKTKRCCKKWTVGKCIFHGANFENCSVKS